ncbi:MAG: methyltransferase [Microbacteriaceae bacterium]
MHQELVAALAADLHAAGYTVEALDADWGADAAAALFRGQRLPAERALAGRDDARAVLARLFVLGARAPADAAARALPRLGLAGARRLGILHRAGDGVEALVDLRPYAFSDDEGEGSWWIASDLGELATGRAVAEDHVLGVGGATATLTALVVARRVRRALDLGTGCGIQALHLIRHAETVVATDISARALDFAALNAALNGLEPGAGRLELRRGDLFEPVAGERFDLIVSNPPFVITPRADGVPLYDYRDGGAVGDGLIERLVRSVGEHLEPGGVAQLLGNWEYRDGRDGLDRVRGWLAGTGLDAWVVERETQDAALYAETWIRDGGTRPGSDRFEELYAAWLDDFAARGVRRVGLGHLTLRRPVAPREPVQRLERLDAPLVGGPGGRIEAFLTAVESLAGLDDADLAGLRLEVAPDVTERRHLWPGDEHPAAIELVQGGGLAREVPVGTALAAVVGACDGELPLGLIVDAVAGLLEADARALRAELLPELRRLVIDGLLAVAR